MQPYKYETNYSFGSYGCNEMYYTSAAGQTGLFRNEETSLGGEPEAPTIDASLEAPSTTVAIVDSYAYDSYYPWMIDSLSVPPITTSSVTGNLHAINADARHLNMINVLWADGHVKSVNLSFLFTTGTAGVPTYWTVNPDPY